MPSITVNLRNNEAYEKAKSSFTEKGCVVTSEEPPKQFRVKQGSLWGVSPKTAKKTVSVTLQLSSDKTIVEYSSKLASDWVNVTVVGCILAAIFAAVCVWLALDLNVFLLSGNPSLWSWLITVEGQAESQAGEALVNLALGVATFLSAAIAIEVAVLLYARRKIETFAKDALFSVI